MRKDAGSGKPCLRVIGSEEGLALLTIMLLMVIMTVLGIAAVTVTSLENRMAGYTRTGQAGAGAAEACLNSAVQIIQQTISAGVLPAAVEDNATPPGPVPAANAATLQAEIMGQSNNNPDDPSVSPNTVTNVNTFTVRGDIDRLYASPKPGGSLQFAGGYEGTAGGAAGGGVDIMYRINCIASNTALGTTARITAVYACTTTGDSCQRKL